MYLLLFQIEVLSFHGFFHLDRSQVHMEADILRISEISFNKAFNMPKTLWSYNYIKLVLSKITRTFYRSIYWRLLRCCPKITSPSRCCGWSWCRSCGCNFHWRNQGAYTWLCYIWLIRISFCFAYSSDFYSWGLVNYSSGIEIRNLEKKIPF